MFYAHFVLAKKGPLARIWLAAHWDKKLTKAHVFETNIEKSVDGILQPKVKMALRTSGHLLLGVVRIYSRKAKYLLADCNEAFVKIKMAFRPGMVDLPEDNREAAINAITLPEVFHDFDSTMPELNDVDIEAQFSLNQSRAEEITMREDYGNMSSLVEHEEGFGDMGFGAEGPGDILRHASRLEQSLEQNLLFSEGVDHLDKDKDPQPSTSATSLDRPGLELDAPIRDDGFGGNLGSDIMAGGLFEGGLFDDAPMQVPVVEQSVGAQDSGMPALGHGSDDDDDDGDRFGGAPSPAGGSSDDGSRPNSPLNGMLGATDMPMPSQQSIFPPPALPPEVAPPEPQPQDHTVLLHNEEESFALGPVDTSALRGSTKTKRKRKLIVDEVKNISGEEMKSQLSDTTDIVTSLDLAPPTKRLMHWKETGGVEKLFALPGRNIPARALFKNYQRHLTSRAVPNEEGIPDTDKDAMHLEHVPEEVVHVPGKRGRKRKILEPEEPPMIEEVKRTPMRVEHEVEHAPEPIPETNGMPIPHMDQTIPQPHATPLQAPNMTPFSLPDTSLPHLPPEQMSLLEQTLAPGQTPLHNMGYDGGHDQGDMMANMGYDEHAPPPTTPGAISEKGQATPWQDDYDLPVSVGPPEEQAMDETFEQFEERVLNKRATHMYSLVRSKLEFDNKVGFSCMVVRNNRKQVAQKFYSLLMLKKFQVVELEQEASYTEIYIERGPKFENPTL